MVDKEVEQWVTAQNKITFGYLKKLPYREEIEKRIPGDSFQGLRVQTQKEGITFKHRRTRQERINDQD